MRCRRILVVSCSLSRCRSPRSIAAIASPCVASRSVAGLRALQLVDDVDQVVLAQKRRRARRAAPAAAGHQHRAATPSACCSSSAFSISVCPMADQVAPIARERSRQGDRDHAVVVDAHPHLEAIELRHADRAAVEGHRRLVVLHVGGGRRFRDKPRGSRQPPIRAGMRLQVDGLRDVEQVEGDDLPGADLRHPGHRIVPTECDSCKLLRLRLAVTAPSHRADSISRRSLFPVSGGVLNALVWVPPAMSSALLFLLSFGTARLGAIRHRLRGRNGARLLRRGRARTPRSR